MALNPQGDLEHWVRTWMGWKAAIVFPKAVQEFLVGNPEYAKECAVGAHLLIAQGRMPAICVHLVEPDWTVLFHGENE